MLPRTGTCIVLRTPYSVPLSSSGAHALFWCPDQRHPHQRPRTDGALELDVASFWKGMEGRETPKLVHIDGLCDLIVRLHLTH